MYIHTYTHTYIMGRELEIKDDTAKGGQTPLQPLRGVVAKV